MNTRKRSLVDRDRDFPILRKCYIPPFREADIHVSRLQMNLWQDVELSFLAHETKSPKVPRHSNIRFWKTAHAR